MLYGLNSRLGMGGILCDATHGCMMASSRAVSIMKWIKSVAVMFHPGLFSESVLWSVGLHLVVIRSVPSFR